ncbi:hypothetical protein AVEN_275208-1 [Araneus ventricosus]|uniref:Uncharacterized protein n=1 Tax=Araneus ventricosus TaxID=182803 RepID=A0A4Y2NP09_ARAVE|nr:hypothetical protein AVEN_275208-1 [Araneus ventricosus]
MGKNGEKSSKEKGDEEDSDEEPAMSSSDFPNELKKLIDNLDSHEFLEDVEEDLRTKIKAFNKFSNTTIQAKLQYGKKLMNKITLNFLNDIIDIIIDLCGRVETRDATIYDLQETISACDSTLARAKIWTLEREKAALQGKLDAQSEISSTIQEIIPKLDELKNSNDQKFNIGNL